MIIDNKLICKHYLTASTFRVKPSPNPTNLWSTLPALIKAAWYVDWILSKVPTLNVTPVCISRSYLYELTRIYEYLRKNTRILLVFL